MKELTANELTNIAGGFTCRCFCVLANGYPFGIGDKSNFSDCITDCKQFGLRADNCYPNAFVNETDSKAKS